MRQYIGARYVPVLFNNNGSSEWVSGRSYEAMTIVTYMNSSYISAKQVPANIGAPSQNPDYWILTGNYNGLLEEYHQEVEQAIDKIEGNFGSEIYDKDYGILCIGDSYFTGTAVSGYETPVTQIKNIFKKTNGVNFFTAAKGGAGFWCYNDNYIMEVVKAYMAGGNISQPNKIRLCLIGLGYNDLMILDSLSLSNISQLSSKMQDFFYYLRTTFINAKIAVTNVNGGFLDVKPNYISLLEKYYCYETLAGKGIYLGNTGNLLKLGDNRQLIANDKIHPTNYGAIHLGEYIAACLMGKSNLNYHWGLLRSTNYAFLDNNILSVYYNMFYTESNFITSAGLMDGSHVVLEIDLGLNLIGNRIVVATKTDNIIVRTNTQTNVFPAILELVDSKIKIKPIIIENNNYLDAANVKSLKLNKGCFITDFSLL